MAASQIAKLLDANISTACDRSAVFNSLFTATAMGYIKPKTASTRACIGRLMIANRAPRQGRIRTNLRASWPDVVCDSPAFNLNNPPEEDESEDTNSAPGESTSTTSAESQIAACDSNHNEQNSSAATILRKASPSLNGWPHVSPRQTGERS